MIVTDCFWELNNLGERTVEIAIEHQDDFCAQRIEDAVKDYQYVVVKVPVGKPDFNFGLASLGYSFVETQFHVSKKISQLDMNDRLVKIFAKGLTFRDVDLNTGLDEVLDKISDNMFTTDRVVLDPHFSPQTGRKRYVNWMRSTLCDKTLFFEMILNGEAVGFGFAKFSDDNKVLDGILGGIYEPFQSCGYGLLTPLGGLLLCKQRNLPVENLVTSVSSNNVVFQLYNYLSYRIDSMTYVYVKHR